uniref:Uncharacterized protein n=1 Tax=Rhizophora mucronata TaxID=61149 RepID=A0A2P2NK05_RHIMU
MQKASGFEHQWNFSIISHEKWSCLEFKEVMLRLRKRK